MASLKEIRNRITSVKSTIKITSAMKTVSASKLKKAQNVIASMLPYSDKLSELLQNLSATLDSDSGGMYSEQRKISKILVVVITSNRGLCGIFNSSIVRETRKIITEKYRGKEIELITIGKKGNDLLSKEYKVIQNNNSIFNELVFDKVATIAESLMQLFLNETYDKIEIVYNSFKNTATQVVKVEPFLPIKIPENRNNVVSDYIFEPQKQEILKTLIPKSLKTQLFKTLCDSFASEHGARMTAMHKATDNANELRDHLLLTYNKARQATITNEILEIVGGAEALNN